MYYQVVDIDNNILEISENIVYVKQDKYFRYIVKCNEKEAQGVAIHNGEQICQLRKKNTIDIDEFLTIVDVSQIDEETYLELKKSLNSEE